MEDIGAFLTDDEKREFVGQQVFNDGSHLWKALRYEIAVPGVARGKGRMVDERGTASHTRRKWKSGSLGIWT